MNKTPIYPTIRSFVEHIGVGCNFYANIDWTNRIRKTVCRVAESQGKKFRTRIDRERHVIIVTRLK